MSTFASAEFVVLLAATALLFSAIASIIAGLRGGGETPLVAQVQGH
jgi:hypothetical protein